MKILHIADFGPTIKNGIVEVVTHLSEAQAKMGEIVKVIVLSSPEICKGITICSSIRGIRSIVLRYEPDIVVFHSLYHWQYPFIAICLNFMKIPYLIEMHGGSSVKSMKKSKIKKKIANFLLFNRFVKKSDGIIYLNKSELEHSVFEHNKIIIPNGVNLNVNKDTLESVDTRITYLFMGRIDFYYKGLEILFEAMNKVQRGKLKNKCVLKLYGPRLDNTIISIVDSTGGWAEYYDPVSGAEKEKVINSCDVFILTSRSEGMPMSILEALAHGKPCLVTPQTNVADIIFKYDAGWITELTVEDIAKTIEQAYEDVKNRRDQLRTNAIKSVKNYSWERIAELSVNEYKKLLNNIS